MITIQVGRLSLTIPRRRDIIKTALVTAAFILLFSWSLLVLWMAISLIGTFYVARNIHISYQRKNDRQRAKAEGRAVLKSEVFLATKRFYQESFVGGATLFLLAVGIAGAFISGEPNLHPTFFERALPIFLIGAHLCLAIYSWMVHVNHHEVVNILTAELLQRDIRETPLMNRMMGGEL